jgi:hypothetical protein
MPHVPLVPRDGDSLESIREWLASHRPPARPAKMVFRYARRRPNGGLGRLAVLIGIVRLGPFDDDVVGIFRVGGGGGTFRRWRGNASGERAS